MHPEIVQLVQYCRVPAHSPSCGPGVCQAVLAVTLTSDCTAFGKRHNVCQPAQGFKEMCSGQCGWRQQGHLQQHCSFACIVKGVLPRKRSIFPHCKRLTC